MDPVTAGIIFAVLVIVGVWAAVSTAFSIANAVRIGSVEQTHQLTCSGDEGCANEFIYTVTNGTGVAVYNGDSRNRSLELFRTRLPRGEVAVFDHDELNTTVEWLGDDDRKLHRITHRDIHSPGPKQYTIYAYYSVDGFIRSSKTIGSRYRVLAPEETFEVATYGTIGGEEIPSDGITSVSRDLKMVGEINGVTVCNSILLQSVRIKNISQLSTLVSGETPTPIPRSPELFIQVFRSGELFEDLGKFEAGTTKELTTPLNFDPDVPISIRFSLQRDNPPLTSDFEYGWVGDLIVLCPEKK